jgi:hypothetical protein
MGITLDTLLQDILNSTTKYHEIILIYTMFSFDQNVILQVY